MLRTDVPKTALENIMQNFISEFVGTIFQSKQILPTNFLGWTLEMHHEQMILRGSFEKTKLKCFEVTDI